MCAACWDNDLYVYLADNSPNDTIVAKVPLPTIGTSVTGGGGYFQYEYFRTTADKLFDIIRTLGKDVQNNIKFGEVFTNTYLFNSVTGGRCLNAFNIIRRRTPSLNRSLPLPVVHSGLLLNIAEFSVNISQPASGLSKFSVCGATSAKSAFSLTYNSTTGKLSVNVNQSSIPMQTSSSPLLVNLSLCLIDNADGKTFKAGGVHNFTSYHNGVSNVTVAVSIPRRKFSFLI